jgi:hypothetical protein
MAIRLVIVFVEFVKVVLKEGVEKEVHGCGLLDFVALCVFGSISVIVMGVCVRDCRGYVQLVQ